MKTEKLTWDSEAQSLLEKAPLFIRKIAKNKVEKAAKALGIDNITVEFVEQIRQKKS